MAKNEANRHLPREEGLLHAFAKVNARHVFGETVEEVSALPIGELSHLVSDYIGAGVGYLAKGTLDPYLQQLAVKTFKAVADGKVVFFYAGDPKLVAQVRFGASAESVAELPDGEPLTLFVDEGAGVLIPPEFMLTAKRNPIEALATVVNICSRIGDFVDGQSPGDPLMGIRAVVTEGYFLKRALRQHPDVALRPYYRELLETFPNGIFSLPTWINQQAFPRVRLDKIRNN